MLLCTRERGYNGKRDIQYTPLPDSRSSLSFLLIQIVLLLLVSVGAFPPLGFGTYFSHFPARNSTFPSTYKTHNLHLGASLFQLPSSYTVVSVSFSTALLIQCSLSVDHLLYNHSSRECTSFRFIPSSTSITR